MSKKQNRSHETLAKPPGLTPKKRERDPPAVPAGADEGGGSARRDGGTANRGSSRSRSSGATSDNNLGTSSTSSTSSRARRAEGRRASSRSTPSLHLPSLSAAPLLRSYRSLGRLDQGSARDETPSAWAMPNSRVKCGPLSSRTSSTIPGAHVSKNSRTNGAQSADVTRAEGVNHRKGWLMRQDSDGQWQRHWFVLAHQILRFYQDSWAEEAADVDGEINLSACYDITEYPAQKNYGFQIHTKDGVYTLCAMTFGSRQNWVQAVLTNVKPDLTQEVKGVTPRSSGRSAHSLDPAGDTEDPKHVAQGGCRPTRHGSCDLPKASNQQPQERRAPEQHETEQGPAEGAAPLREPSSSTVPSSSSSSFSRGSLAPSSSPVPRGLPHLEEEEEPEEEQARCNRRPLAITPTHTGGAYPFSGAVESPASEGDRPTETLEPLQSQVDGADGQAAAGPEEPPPPASVSRSSVSGPGPETETAELNTGQLLKELEQTQRELAQLQQLNKNLQDQLEEERQCLLAGDFQDGASNSPLQVTAFHRLQRINRNLCLELAAQRRSQEEAKEAELCRRAELCARHSQLLVTGEAGDLSCVQLEKDHRRSQDRQEEWESQMASLQSQLQQSEDQRKEVERSLLTLQRDTQSYQGAQEEAGRLRERLQEVMVHLRSNEEAQAQKEARLQTHLLLLQESQDRERRRLASGLDQAESRSLDLKERLERAEQQCLSKGPSWTREIQEAQQQLQDELACTVAAVKKLQEEREQLRCHCQDLENQLGEVDAEVSRLRNRLKTEETDYYNLEHSYERASEDLQLALGKVDQREAELQDIREGYERLLDRKEQELREVLVKMEILGNSLEETEVKLSEVLKACTCSSEQDQSVVSVKFDQRPKNEDPLGMSNNCPKMRSNSLTSTSSNGLDFTQQNSSPSNEEHARSRSRSIDPSFQYFVTNGEDQDRFMDVIQVLETKLYVTEEKLRDITQRLEEHQSHMICQDPRLCSQLTQSKANAQHLSLLLHKQAKQNQRFAQQTESRSRLLVITFQAALTALEVARQTLLSLRQNLKDGHNKIDATELEKQLAAVVACLQQGERNAEEQQQESYYSIREESRITRDDLSTGGGMGLLSDGAPEEVVGGNTGRLLKNEAQLVEKMVLALQNREGIARLQLEPSTHVGDVVQRLKCLTSQKIDLKNEINSSKSLEGAIGRVCAEAEIIYTAFILQWQYETCWRDKEKCPDPATKTSLADVCPPEKTDPEESGKEDASKSMEYTEYKEQQVLARLVSQLQRRAKTLRKLCQEICDAEAGHDSSTDQNVLNHSTMDGQGMREQAMLIYIFDRLHLDFNLELQRCKEERDRLKALCQGHEVVLVDEQQRFSQDLSRLQQQNTALREQLEDIERKRTVAEAGNQQLLGNIHAIESYHKERIQKLEVEFQKKIKELQDIHEEEMKQLVVYFSKSASVSDTSTSPSDMSKSDESLGTGQEEPLSVERTEGQKDELDSEFQTTREDLGFHMCDSNQTSTMRKAYQADFEKLKDSCDQGISAMEEMYRQLVEDLKQQHQSEVADLLREKDKQLKEETAATMAAIGAMKRAHKAELERSQRTQNVLESGDVARLQAEHEKEMRVLREELEVLSVQHTHRCVQNSEMGEQLERERRALAQCQEQIQDLRSKEGTSQRASEDQTPSVPPVDLTPQGSASASRDLQEMEISLRVRDTELQSLRQEAQTLREELRTALMDKAQVQNQLQSPPQRAVPWFRPNPLAGTRKPPVGQGHASDDIIVAKSDSAFRRKKSFTQHIRERSKSLKEGLSVQERRKLFES